MRLDRFLANQGFGTRKEVKKLIRGAAVRVNGEIILKDGTQIDEEKDEVSVDQKAVYVEEFIRTHKRFSFRALLEKQHSKVEVIVTFLVVLELMKTGKITVEQASINDDMTVISREEQMA